MKPTASEIAVVRANTRFDYSLKLATAIRRMQQPSLQDREAQKSIDIPLYIFVD